MVDETGDLKKGSHTVGVQRQYTGTAGCIENAQVAVYLTYASDRGHALIDRALYLPESWAADAQRRGQAGVPEEVAFATKPALAREMIARALDAGVPARWAAGDEVYGADPGLREECERRGVGYVLAVACSHRVTTAAGTLRADVIAASLPRRAWQRLSAGPGSKGPRYYDWAWISFPTADAECPGQRWLLIRRNNTTGELAFYRCYAPQPVPLATLVRIAGRRWTIEESFQASKRTDRTRSTPSPPLGLLAALDPPGDARLRLPRPTRGNRTRPPPPTRRTDSVDLQRNPPSVQHPDRPPDQQPQPSPALVDLATTPPTPGQNQPLSATNTDPTVKIPISAY